MTFVLACYGSRGDVEPGAALGRELLRRGHEVRMAVTPDLVRFVESAGLGAVAFGPDLRSFTDAQRNFGKEKIQDRIREAREARRLLAKTWRQTSTTLTPLAAGADILITNYYLEESAANIADYYRIPLATLHTHPRRANSQLVPTRWPRLTRSVMTVNEWLLYWQMFKKVEDAQRRELGLPKATTPPPRRIAKRGSLEIQTYDEVCFPGLAAEWTKWHCRRPFVGVLTMELSTDTDDEVASWIAAGRPPICFSLGSTPVESPIDTVEMISAACAQLGERALVCAGATDISHVPRFGHVKVVGALNYPSVFPACRAAVHHGGSGTTAASLRAGIPTLILWTWPDQAVWGAQVVRLKVGTARRFSATTRESLVADLRQLLMPEYATRARKLSMQMTKPAESVANAADLVEKFARSQCFE
jgi:UDP:flavonoid glycosyltransferase YjiC (YdhE family)